jgi:hypothetical protein
MTYEREYELYIYLEKLKGWTEYWLWDRGKE